MPCVVLVLGLVVAASAASAAGAPAPCVRCLKAGAAMVRLSVPSGAPLAGYGSPSRRPIVPDIFGRSAHAFWFKPHEGVLDDLAARALVLEGAGVRIVWIAVDLIAVDRSFTEAVAARLPPPDAARSTLIVSASHTHSGPGAFMESGLMALVATDRADRNVRQSLIAGLVEAARRAHTAMAPARIGAATVEAPPVVIGRLGGTPDPDMVVMKVVATSGEPIAALWNFAIHGTMLPPKNLAISGDVTGLASREIERALGVPALYVNGAVGDVSPKEHGYPAAVMVAGELAATVRSAFGRIDARDTRAPTIRTDRIALPAPALSIKNCLGGWMPRAVRLPLDGALPRETTLIAARVGDAAWVTVPGELQSRLGVAIKRAAQRHFRHPFVAGVSNDYLGYFMGGSEYERPAYVTCASVYGPEAGEQIARRAADLLGALGRDQR